MVGLADTTPSLRHHLEHLECQTFPATPWSTGRPLAKRRIAIVSTAGLQKRGDRPFALGASDYRVIPGDTPGAEIVMSHISTNFDRSGYQQDLNVVFPIDRLRSLPLAERSAPWPISTIRSWGQPRRRTWPPRRAILRGCCRLTRWTEYCWFPFDHCVRAPWAGWHITSKLRVSRQRRSVWCASTQRRSSRHEHCGCHSNSDDPSDRRATQLFRVAYCARHWHCLNAQMAPCLRITMKRCPRSRSKARVGYAGQFRRACR